MKRKITLTLFTLLSGWLSVHSQNYVHKVIILNEGKYDYVNQVQIVPVTLGVYDPTARVYTSVDTIRNARFGSHVMVDGLNIYVAADNKIIRYDADSYQRLSTATLPGVRKLAVWNNQLLVSRGEYLQTFSSYFNVFDKNNLGFLYDLPVASGPQYASEGIVVKNDTAYIAINNGYNWGNEVGLIGRIDLVNQNYLNEINLGIHGKNPEHLVIDDNTLYTVNNNDYTVSSISSVNIASQAVNTVDLNVTSGCGASTFASDYIVFQASGDTKLGRFSTSTFTMYDTLYVNRNIYGMATDDINNLLYIGETDYSTYGKILMFDYSGAVVDSFDVSIAPGNIALDIRSAAGVHESVIASGRLSCYPNPASERITILSAGKNNSLEDIFVLTDLTGREVKRIFSAQHSFTLDLHSLDAGMYVLQSMTDSSLKTKIVKQ